MARKAAPSTPTAPAAVEPFKLSPSDFSFLWNECKRCFWLKVKHKIDRPRGIMPSVFNRIDGAMKDYFNGSTVARLRTQAPGLDLPNGTLRFGQEYVKSAPFKFGLPEGSTSPGAMISGRLDTRIFFEEGSLGIVDFKTSIVKADNVAHYARQLHAYKYAEEHPAPGAKGQHISRLGLLTYEPGSFDVNGNVATLGGRLVYLPIPIDEEAFKAFLAEVLRLLESPLMPEPGPACGHCQYVENFKMAPGAVR